MNTDLLLLVASRQINPNQAKIITYFELLGPFGIHVVGTALLAFLLTGLILWRGKGNFAGAALVLVVFSPLMLGMFAGMHLATRSLLEITGFLLSNADAASKLNPVDHYMLVLDALAPPSIALFLSIPTYLLAMIGAFIKAMRGRGDVTAQSH